MLFCISEFAVFCRDDEEGHVRAMRRGYRRPRAGKQNSFASLVIMKGDDTYSEESIKYIPRAPMLSAKTNTTCKRREETQTEGELAPCTKQRQFPECVVNKDRCLVEANTVGAAAVIKRQLASYSSASTHLFCFFFHL